MVGLRLTVVEKTALRRRFFLIDTIVKISVFALWSNGGGCFVLMGQLWVGEGIVATLAFQL